MVVTTAGQTLVDTCLPSDYPVSLSLRSLPLIPFLYFLSFCVLQLSGWVDAVLFVFSLEDESSFSAVSTYYHRMIHLRSNDNIPVFLVGTQGESLLGFTLTLVITSFCVSFAAAVDCRRHQ